MAHNTHTAFDKIEFPPYAFREFPMAVPVDEEGKIAASAYNDHGKSNPVVIVESQEELDALQGPGVMLVEVSPGSSRPQNEADIRAALYVQADTRGVQYDRSWPVERIEKALRDAASEVV